MAGRSGWIGGMVTATAMLLATQAAAQGRAEGRYPSVIFCDALPFAAAAARQPFELEVAAGRARYRRLLGPSDGPGASGTAEAGEGTVSAGQAVLTARVKGRDFSYEARYAGAIDGRGGLLTGVQSWTRGGKTFKRACQMTIGNGRG